VNLRFIDWIWHIRGNVALAPGQSSEEAFERLDPLFHESGTTHERTGDTLTFRKKGQLAQDKMSIFDGGTLRIEQGADGPVLLRYHLTSKALLFCFLAPLLFLALAGISTGLGIIEKPTAEEAAKDKQEAEEDEKRYSELPQNPIDEFLGAPAPEKPKTEAEKKKEEAEKKAKGETDEPQSDHNPIPAYVFAGIFAALYIGGRILEAWLINRLFRKKLAGEETAPAGAKESLT
jgi:hypothetical protein